MAQLPLTVPFFSTENENNIIVAQEQARPHPETDQLVSSTPHMPRWRRDNGEMLCVLLAPSPIDTAPDTRHLLPHTLMREQRRVLLEDMLPLPSQATTHQGGGLDLLVCPPLPRNASVARWLHRMEIVPGTALQSLTSYEERSEVVCGVVGWRRTSHSTPYYASNTTKPIGNKATPHSGVGKGFEASDTNEHATSHHTLQPPQPSVVMTVHDTPVTLHTTSHLVVFSGGPGCVSTQMKQ